MGQIAPYLKHVVLADDDLDHAYLFRKALRQVDDTCVLTIVRDGAELMEFLSVQVPELLFLDLNMPCKHGLECLQEIRKDPRLAQMVVVVYTSSTEMTNIQRSYIHKADLYMVKPFNSEHLRNALESVLKMEWKAAPTPGHYFINNRFVPYTA
jgi:CheY-like chemotaxis protein